MKASDIMSTNLAVVPPEMPVAAVAEMLAARGISGVPVVDESGAAVGLVTESDLIQRLAERPRGALEWFLGLFGDSTPQIIQYEKAHGKTARDVMTAPLHTAREDTPVAEIARMMERNRIRRVPVVKEGRLVGIVSRADLLRALLRPPPAPSAAPSATDDRSILRAVIAAMREQPWTDTFWVYPNVEQGVVTLYGYARSQTMREGLRVLVQEIPGVRSVVDRMEDMPLIIRAMS